jgi:short-subunit dehydrogenase
MSNDDAKPVCLYAFHRIVLSFFVEGHFIMATETHLSLPVCAIIGAGKGISMGIAEKFGSAGYRIVLISRTEPSLEFLCEELQGKGITANYIVADTYSPDSVRSALRTAKEQWGTIEVLHYNAAAMKMVELFAETAEELAKDFLVSVGNAHAAVMHVLPDMQTQRRGTILFTGGGFSMYPDPRFASLSLGKSGLRSLAQQFHSLLKDTPIHVGTVTVCGYVSNDSPKHTPTAIAEEFWKIHTGTAASWEIVF